MNNKNYRLRIAPSPTGYPHIGTIYQALFNYAYAKKHEGSFIVRIEDTDRARFVEDAEEVIFSSLDWFNLTENESPRKGGEFAPYRQSERLNIYQKYAQELIDNGHAFFSYIPKENAGVKKDYSKKENLKIENLDTHEEPPKDIADMLSRTEKNWVVRMKVPGEGTITVHDGIRGDITFDYKQVTQQILIKSDGFPTYHLAVVIDDHLMEISHILRAEEWLPSLPKHVLLYQYFGWEMPEIYHTATLRNADKSKLSKRHGHTNVNWFREEGYLPEAVINYLGLLGWSHPEEKEIFSLKEFIELFDLKDIRPVAPIFDLQKLTWMNGEYIRRMTISDLSKLLINHYPEYKDFFVKETFHEVVALAQSRMNTLNEFNVLAKHYISPFEISVTEEQRNVVEHLLSTVDSVSEWKSEEIMQWLRDTLQMYKIKMPVLYTIFTGQPRGLPLPESLVILGKEKALQRLEKYR